MPPGIWNPSWNDQNSERRYPLANSASGRDVSGSFVLPEDFLLSLYIPVHAGLDTDSSKFFILAINCFANGFSVAVGYQPDEADPIEVAVALINRDTHESGTSYTLGGRGAFTDTVGHLTIGSLDNIDQQPQGRFTFSFEDTRLEPDCIRPIIRGVSGLRVRNGTDVSQLLTGIVELVADTNMQITPEVVSGEEPVLRFSAIEGEGLTEECVCDENTVGEPVRSINNVKPDNAGNISLIGDDCIEVSAIQNGLQLRDTCSKPCCGCQELEAITRDLERFGASATTLEIFMTRLETSVSGMDMVVLGSRLNDRGCLS